MLNTRKDLPLKTTGSLLICIIYIGLTNAQFCENLQNRKNYTIRFEDYASSSRCYVRPYKFYRFHTGFTDWIHFTGAKLSLEFKRESHHFSLGVAGNFYSHFYQSSGFYYDSFTHSYPGGGGTEEDVATADYSFQYRRMCKLSNRFAFLYGLGFVALKVIPGNPYDSHIDLSSKIHYERVHFYFKDQKKFGYAFCVPISIRYQLPRWSFSLTAEYQQGIREFSRYQIEYWFDRDYFKGTISTRGEAIRLGIGVGYQMQK